MIEYSGAIIISIFVFVAAFCLGIIFISAKVLCGWINGGAFFTPFRLQQPKEYKPVYSPPISDEKLEEFVKNPIVERPPRTAFWGQQLDDFDKWCEDKLRNEKIDEKKN